MVNTTSSNTGLFGSRFSSFSYSCIYQSNFLYHVKKRPDKTSIIFYLVSSSLSIYPPFCKFPKSCRALSSSLSYHTECDSTPIFFFFQKKKIEILGGPAPNTTYYMCSMACGGFLRSPVDATYSGLLEREKLGNLASLSRPLAADRFVSFLFFFFFFASSRNASLLCLHATVKWLIG